MLVLYWNLPVCPSMCPSNKMSIHVSVYKILVILCLKLLYFCFNCINPFPNKPWFLRVCSTSLLKTLREKEKLLVTSNFSFSHNVFYPFVELSAIFINFEILVCKPFQFGRIKVLLFGKGLIFCTFIDHNYIEVCKMQF